MTIGDLERSAGIEQTPEARARFWKPFAHLEGRAMLDAGREELQRLIWEKDQANDKRVEGLTAEEREALRIFATEHGRCWKAALRKQWMNASASPFFIGCAIGLGHHGLSGSALIIPAEDYRHA